jgi:hypothetical protein
MNHTNRQRCMILVSRLKNCLTLSVYSLLEIAQAPRLAGAWQEVTDSVKSSARPQQVVRIDV